MRTIEIDTNTIYGVLSNYAHTPFSDGYDTYKTVLHAYYAYLNRNNRKNIISSNNVDALQQQLGFDKYKRAASVLLHNKYYRFAETVDILRSILYLKALANPSVKKLLLQTGDAELIMLNGSDLVLGIGRSRRGLNLTGVLWMQIRDYFANSRNSSAIMQTTMARINQDCNEELNDTLSTICTDPTAL
jgi:predicted NAD-dependent protein-ADP-ribosyltransferase YbiA (DUF1768 family)